MVARLGLSTLLSTDSPSLWLLSLFPSLSHEQLSLTYDNEDFDAHLQHDVAILLGDLNYRLTAKPLVGSMSAFKTASCSDNPCCPSLFGGMSHLFFSSLFLISFPAGFPAILRTSSDA